MAQQERPPSPSIGSHLSNVAKSSARSSLSPLRHRTLQRAATFADNYSSPGLQRRRSSTFSDSAQSLKSSTDSLLLPRAKSSEEIARHEEHSHWHSIPLALALLPAVGGLVFPGGSAPVTDVTLLAMAAIFLNWSVRLPWDWYHAAQEIKVDDAHPLQAYKDRDTIIEEEEESEEQSSPSPPATPVQENGRPKSNGNVHSPEPKMSRTQLSAAKELRFHELSALLACFVSPLIAAWLLHHIRAQLSRPSEGLVSNYNLTIFLLAAELRPFSHAIKLVQVRTLHLQRAMVENPHRKSSSIDSTQELSSRVSELEAQMAERRANGPASTQQQQQELVTAVRKTLQSDLDPLNRAVRRYEKRSTLSTMQTESRLQELEKKLADAITLAAAAERSSQASRQRRGSGVALLVDWTSKAFMLPLQAALAVVSIPGHVLSLAAKYLEAILGFRTSNARGEATKGDHRASRDPERRRMSRGPKKVS